MISKGFGYFAGKKQEIQALKKFINLKEFKRDVNFNHLISVLFCPKLYTGKELQEIEDRLFLFKQLKKLKKYNKRFSTWAIEDLARN